jgi:hypothetical protein
VLTAHTLEVGYAQGQLKDWLVIVHLSAWKLGNQPQRYAIFIV